MDDVAARCPRCKQIFSSGSADQLADALIAHVEQEHGHAPPREHVLARIERHDPASGRVFRTEGFARHRPEGLR